MPEPKGPFDAAIDVLEGGEHVDYWVRIGCGRELTSAIRVLEAAGKVDKGRAIRTLATLLLVYTESGRIIPALEQALKDGAVREIRVLLEALPDKEEK